MRTPWPIAATAAALAGCADSRLCREPVAAPPHAACAAPSIGDYRLGCPDLVEVRFAGHPEWDSLASVDVDGRLPLGPAGRPAVAGLPAPAAREAVAKVAGVAPESVALSVAEFRSARLYLSGPLNDWQRTVPYRGPERTLDFLRRAGAFRPGTTDPRSVRVVRPNVAPGGVPQEFAVDVAAVVERGDDGTNVVLEPSDEVMVGETRRSRFSRVVPKWALPAYRAISGIE